jgi:hypothetical protein
MRRASCQVGCAAPLEHTPPALLQHAAFLGQQKAQEGGGGSMGWTVGCWPPDRRACPPCAPAPPGFGQLHPRSQGITTLGTIYSSSLFPGRVPTGQVLLLSYFGGAQNRRVADMSDEELVEQVRVGGGGGVCRAGGGGGPALLGPLFAPRLACQAGAQPCWPPCSPYLSNTPTRPPPCPRWTRTCARCW